MSGRAGKDPDEPYLTGTWALNLESPDGTPGDWHRSALDWEHVEGALVPLSSSPFGALGLYRRDDVAGIEGLLVADHVRACLDLIAQGRFGSAQGMRDCYLDDPKTIPVVFDAVWAELRHDASWPAVDGFMGREYGCRWLDFKEEKNGHL